MLKRRALVACAVACALLRTPLFAIGYSGRVLFGDVPVPGAAVVASRGDRHVSTTTDEDGRFTFADLDAGAWSVRVEMLAFVPFVQEITVAPGGAPVEWKLTLRPIEELARGTPAPVAAAPVAAAARPAPTKPPALATAAPRPAAPPAATRAAMPARPAPPGPDDANDATAATTADGLVINGSVNNGGVTSFAQSAAFGNNRRQATGLYNGGLAIVFGTSALDSRPFTFSGVPAARPEYQNMTFSGNFGGPIKISRVPAHNPVLFVSLQHASDHNATTQPAVMPTAAERTGDFSQAVAASGQPVQIHDPLTGQPFAGNIIPASRISRQAASLLQYFPLPTLVAGTGFNFQAPLLNSSSQTSLSTRLTQVLGPNDQIIGLFAYQRQTTSQTTLFDFTDDTSRSGVDTSLAWNHRVNRTLYLRTRYQFTGVTNRTTPFFAGRVNVSGDAGIVGNDQDPVNWGPPALQFSTTAGLSDASPALTTSNTHGAMVEMTWTHGAHNLTFGGDGRHVATDVRSQLNPRGSFTFTGAASGSDLADFLLGLPATSTIAFGNADKDFRARAYDAYLTDDWRFSPKLTLQVGARWEYEAPPTERLGRLVNLDIAPGFSAISAVRAGDVGPLTSQRAPGGLFQPDRSGVQPRLALAWRPIVGSSLLVRAGYGIYRNAGLYQPITTLLAQQPPLSTAFTVSSTPSAPLSLASGFSAPAGTASNTFGVDPNLRVGRSQNWQVLVQRDLWGFLTFSASYLGTKGDRLLQEFLPNTYPIGAVNPCPGCPSGFVYLTSNGDSSRNAGQWQVRWRLHRGLAASLQYTLAKSTDNAGAFTGVNLGGSAIAQDWQDLDAERARSNFDQRHQVTAQVQYTSGVGLGNGGLMDGVMGRVLAGWTIAAQLNAGSGLPFTPVYLAAVPGTGVVGTIRPSFTGAPLTAPSGRYLNPDAYAPPAPGHWGDVPRNSVDGPAQFSFDLGVARAFQWTRRLSVDWRIDATNVLNRETYTGVNAVVGSSQFGLPNLANTPRRVLSTMRVRF